MEQWNNEAISLYNIHMFYLKYRPHTIEEIDNTPAREALSHILKAKDLPHAYAFIGTKGTGKTSTARIFAKAVNCLENAFAGKSTDYNPCNLCANCIGIDTSSSTDVFEMDAASNRGIEEVKNLIKEAAFAPMSGRYRVFIIDEAHMITTEGFNALLKTLEEPPASVMFILATTNEEKIPKTILSRCFKILFGKAGKQDVVRMLERINQKEKLTVSDAVLKLIADHSDNSFRDAAKLFNELMIQNKLEENEARGYMGVRSKQSLFDILQTKSLREALTWVDEFSNTGGSTKNLIEDLLEDLRGGLLYTHGVVTDEDYKVSLTQKEIILLLKLLQESYTFLRSTPIESIPLELAIVEFYNRRTT